MSRVSFGQAGGRRSKSCLTPLALARREKCRSRRRRTPIIDQLENRVVLSPTIFTVTSTGDSSSDPRTATSGDLRYCIGLANANTSNPAGSLIEFSPTVFSTPQTIDLTSGLVLSNTSEPTSITAPAASPVTLWGGRSTVSLSVNFVILSVASNVTGSISGLTIANAYRGGADTSGAGVYNAGNLTLTGCTITGNFAQGDGVTSGQGGGLFNIGTATLSDCAISGNSAQIEAGGIYNHGTATLTDCTVSGNRAGDLGGEAGGLGSNGTLVLTNCTISGNTCLGVAGGLMDYTGHDTITDCTISANVSGLIGGLYTDKIAATLTDTIVAGNIGGDVAGSVTGSYNLIGTDSAVGFASGADNIVGVTDPFLAPLGNYGGPTQTMPLLPGSPALDAGSAVSGITTDERGVARPASSPDIGAFQSQGFTLTLVPGGTPQETTDGTAFPDPLQLAVAARNPAEPVTGGVVTFTDPSSGASAALTTGTIGSGGSVSVIAADNSVAGSYIVTASITGVAPVTFSLTNLASSLVTNYTVDSASGAMQGSGTSGTLPYVVFLADANANTESTGSTIGFASSVFSTAQTITLGATLTLSETLGSLAIAGPGESLLTISGGNVVGVFQVDKGVTAKISGVSISDGDATYSGGGLKNQGNITVSNCSISGNQSEYGRGGGVYNDGTASIYGCTISGNSTYFGGSGLYNSGIATLTDCTISGNSLAGTHQGGGILNYNGAAVLTLNDCSINGNQAFSRGGGIYNGQRYESGLSGYGTVVLKDCTISGNTADYAGGGLSNNGIARIYGCTINGNRVYQGVGGGLSNAHNATLTNCTIYGNYAEGRYLSGYVGGGGVYNDATASIRSCTITGNSAASGCGLYNVDLDRSSVKATAVLTNTIISGNIDNSANEDDINGNAAVAVTGSYNLIGADSASGFGSGTGNLVGTTNPDLAPLANYGGPTETMALEHGSPAIGAGTALAGVTTDQRGLPLDSPPDIGAYQTQLISLSFAGLANPTITYGAFSVTFSGTLSNGDQFPSTGEIVAVTLDGVTQPAPIETGGAFVTTFDTSALGAASLPYTVSYSFTHDGTFASESATSTLTVNRASPEVSVTASSGSFDGSAFNATATVAGLSGVPASTLEGVAPIPVYYAGSSASGDPLPGAPISSGTYTVVAEFPGSADYLPSTSAPTTFAIGKVAPSVRLASSTGAYDGGPVAAIAAVTGVSGVPAPELEGVAPTLVYYAGSTATGSALPGEPVDPGLYTVVVTFPGSMDYLAASSQPAPFTILPAPLTVAGITAANKVYDTGTAATLSTSAASLVGVFGDDVVNLSTSGAMGAFASPSAGNGITVTVAGLTISGPQAVDYTLTQPTITASITPAPLTVSGITADNKVYNASATASLDTSSATLAGVLGGDSVTLGTAGASGTFASDNVGTAITVTVAGLTISGAQAGDYTVTPPTVTASITPAPLTVSGIKAANKVYDATSAATLKTANAALVGVFTGDTVNLSTTGATGTFASVGVGTGITVTVAGLTLSGAQAGDYILTQPTTTASITPAPLTVSGITAPTKIYNASAVGPLNTSDATLAGVISGDTVALNTAGATGTFASDSVGTGITVTVTGLTISGAQAADYTLAQPTTTANITPAPLTVSGITAANKVYNASATATVNTSGAALLGVFSGDTVHLNTSGAAATFASVGAGPGITVTVTGLTISGAQAGDYTLTQPTTTANIIPASLTVSGISAANKAYDASTTAVLNTSRATLAGVYSGDTVTLDPSGATGSFASAGVGTGITVTIVGLTLSGLQAADYIVIPPTTTADITPAALTVSGITVSNKVYDGSTSATINTTSAALLGVFSGDTVTLNTNSARGAFTTDSVATDIAVTVTGLTISGLEASDYTLSPPTMKASITPATPTVSASDSGGTYNGLAFDATASVAGVNGQAASSLEGVGLTLVYFFGSTATGDPLGAAPQDAGTYTVVATYPGSTDYAMAASAPVSFTIGQGSPMVGLSSSGNSAVFGQAVTFVATVTAPGGPPIGTVTFSDGGTTLGTVALDGSGTATLTSSALATGAQSIAATYSGDGDLQAALSTAASVAVARDSTEIALVTQPVFNRKKIVSLRLEAVVKPLAPGAGLPTGLVTFEVQSKNKRKATDKVLETALLDGGTASLTLKPGTVNQKTIIILYRGDTDFASSQATSPALTQPALETLARPKAALFRPGARRR